MSIETDGIAYARGRFVALDEPVIPIDDRAHQFGDGIYEVIRVYRGKPHLLEAHIQRFDRSAKAIGLTLDRSLDGLVALIEEAIVRSQLQESQVYFQLSRGIARRDHAYPAVPTHLSLTVRPVDDSKFTAVRERGQRVILSPDIRWQLCFIKSLNLLPNVMTKQKALDAGVNDALFVRDGFITEGTSSNVAMIKDGMLITHPATEHILHGITRASVLSMCADLGIAVEEKRFTPTELMTADEIFTMSTLTEIAPIIEIDGQAVGLKALSPGSVVRRLQSAYTATLPL
ncbi:MAG: aminotransferase class IV [Firmicutes bacterium]|nr:aminotransferase class IV [Bacillota bacterium]